MAIEDWLQGKKGLASLLPGKGGERMKPLPPGFKRFLQQPPTLRPPIEEPGGPRPPRPPGESIQAKIDALKMQKRQLIQQLRQIDAQIRSLGRERPIRDPWDFGGEPPMPTPWDPQPIGPPTMPVPTIPIGPGTPIPQPPTQPPPRIIDPPWGG